MNDVVKGALKSKTIWFNTAVLVGGVASAIADHAGFVSFLVPGAGPIIAGLGALGIGLRYFTNQDLRDKVNKVVKEVESYQTDNTVDATPTPTSQPGDG